MRSEAKTRHGLARAVRRGLANMRIQAYLTAAAINLKRLAALIATALCALIAAAISQLSTTLPAKPGGAHSPA